MRAVGVFTGNARCNRADDDFNVRADGPLRLVDDERVAPAERDPVFTPPVRPGAALFERGRAAERDVLRESDVACERVPRRDPLVAVMAYLLPKLSNGRIHREETRSLSQHRRPLCPLLQQLLLRYRQEYSQSLSCVRATIPSGVMLP
jgi:hypothetical protein